MNSKNKGNTFERKIANLLSARFASLTGIAKAFRRATDSGSFFGGKNESRIVSHDVAKANFGDIICPSEFAYSIECKHYKEPPSLSNLIDGCVRDWDKWIAQATQDCLNSGKRMLIIVKYNNQKEFVIVREVPPEIKASVGYGDCHILPLATFLAMPDKEFFSPCV
jgi:hypothetical protein